MACGDHSIVNADEGNAEENERDDTDAESQDEGDMGYGARPGGGFTSAVSIECHANIDLNLSTLGYLNGYCIAQPVGSPEEAVGSRDGPIPRGTGPSSST
jgi:hypothetical protein